MSGSALTICSTQSGHSISLIVLQILCRDFSDFLCTFVQAQSIRKTYEAIVKRLKAPVMNHHLTRNCTSNRWILTVQDERIGFDNQLCAIERTLKAKESHVQWHFQGI